MGRRRAISVVSPTVDDVAALTKRAKRNLGVLCYEPLAGTKLAGQAKRFELAQPADLLRQELVGLSIGLRGEVDDAIAFGIAHKLAIELRPAFSLDLVLQAATDLKVRARTKFLGNAFLRSPAHTMTDIVPRNNEVVSVIGSAAQNDMDMWIIGVPMIDPDPIESRAEVSLDLAHEVPRKTLQAGHLNRVFGRDDKPKMMPVAFTAFGKTLYVGVIGLRPEHERLLPTPRDALAAEIGQMGTKA
jgi:hypothetical protein